MNNIPDRKITVLENRKLAYREALAQLRLQLETWLPIIRTRAPKKTSKVFTAAAFQAYPQNAI